MNWNFLYKIWDWDFLWKHPYTRPEADLGFSGGEFASFQKICGRFSYVDQIDLKQYKAPVLAKFSALQAKLLKKKKQAKKGVFKHYMEKFLYTNLRFSARAPPSKILIKKLRQRCL